MMENVNPEWLFKAKGKWSSKWYVGFLERENNHYSVYSNDGGPYPYTARIYTARIFIIPINVEIQKYDYKQGSLYRLYYGDISGAPPYTDQNWLKRHTDTGNLRISEWVETNSTKEVDHDTICRCAGWDDVFLVDKKEV